MCVWCVWAAAFVGKASNNNVPFMNYRSLSVRLIHLYFFECLRQRPRRRRRLMWMWRLRRTCVVVCCCGPVVSSAPAFHLRFHPWILQISWHKVNYTAFRCLNGNGTASAVSDPAASSDSMNTSHTRPPHQNREPSVWSPRCHCESPQRKSILCHWPWRKLIENK